MLRSLLSGFVLALCAAMVLLIGGGSDLEHVALLGAALGGVIGLVPNDTPLGKLGGFALGFAVAWIAFGIRALWLPDSTAGRAVAAFLVMLVCGTVAAVAAGKVPLWSTLVGVAAIVGAYETSYTSSPAAFLSASPQAATTVLLAAGFGFIGTTVITTLATVPDATPTSPSAPTSMSAPMSAPVSASVFASTSAPVSAPTCASTSVPVSASTFASTSTFTSTSTTPDPRPDLTGVQDTVEPVMTGESK